MFPNYSIATLLALSSRVLGHSISCRQENSTTSDPQILLDQAITALGGNESISALQNVAYIGGTIFRSKSILFAISLDGLDAPGVTTGLQNITFSYSETSVTQRIDKFAQLGPHFTFGRPNLPPMDYSMVVQTGDSGFASIVRGSFNFYAPTAEPTGYTDGLLAEYMISEAHKWNPLLLSTIKSNSNLSFRQETVGAVQLSGMYDENLGIAVFLDPQTQLPHTIRTYENHPFFGPSTADLRVSHYRTVEGVQLPSRFKQIYNNKHVLSDYRADEILVDSEIAADFFAVTGTIPETSVPARNPEYDFAEIGESTAVFFWAGPFSGTLETLQVIQPIADLPSLWQLDFGSGFRQAVVELDDGSVIVIDASAHQSKVLIEWAEQTLGKPVTHVWPSHHHHDHAFGLTDYVAIGAKVILPETSVGYYAALNLSDAQVITYTVDTPYTVSDNRTQLALVHMGDTIHAEDIGYAYIRPAFPTTNSSTAIFDADHCNLNFIETFDQGTTETLLSSLAADGVAANAMLIAAHGPVGTLQNLTNVTSFPYPNHSPLDFQYSS